ncbi:hypothetical protein DRW41_01420 [Neobacillus piezotolerans]|uniref:Uncharacterized protein n=1 Tax=Neobacillus piezotolerans TaxID=2259171 RepID=A0A3D8GUX5_9BACI|nr:hypothetical protein [Neobacillus piezotolerans]RDU38258.1 hypothetical protein DRW41_01420 [Neobacillus piezotolerans]
MAKKYNVKKVLAGLLALFAAGVILFYSKMYYPPLPIKHLSKKEVFEKAHGTNGQIVKLSFENNYAWYISNERNMEITDEAIKELITSYGWTFFQKEGSGLFFKKQEETLIVSTQKWTADYTLIKIPAGFNL